MTWVKEQPQGEDLEDRMVVFCIKKWFVSERTAREYVKTVGILLE